MKEEWEERDGYVARERLCCAKQDMMRPHMRMAMLLDTWRPSAHMNAISGAERNSATSKTPTSVSSRYSQRKSSVARSPTPMPMRKEVTRKERK